MNIAFPFYDNISKQTRYRQLCKGESIHRLIAPHDRLLPFVIKRLKTGELIKCLNIFRADGTLYQYVDVSKFSYKLYSTITHDYIVYFGAIIDTLQLPCGQFYAEIDGWVSEVFTVSLSLPDYLRMEWTNSKNIGGIPYQTGWTNRLYLDSAILKQEPVIEEEVQEDGFGNQYPIFQKIVRKFAFDTGPVPGYLMDALGMLYMHDNVVIGEYSNVRRIDANYNEVSACSSNIRITFEEDEVIISKGCVPELALVEVDQTGYIYREYLCKPGEGGPWEVDPSTVYCVQDDGSVPTFDPPPASNSSPQPTSAATFDQSFDSTFGGNTF